MHRLLALVAALLIAPFAAAAPPVLVEPAGFVQVADKKKDAKPKASAKKTASQKKAAPASKKKSTGKQVAKKKQPPKYGGYLADFGKAKASADVMHLANWVAYTGRHQKYAFVIIDKKDARLYVFDNKAKLRSSAPVLLGKGIGDVTAPGVGSKKLSQLREHEKTTPAGWFAARPGRNNHGEDVIWIDYDSGVSMHRLRPVDPKERRAHRLATPTSEDNRISNGCVNVPPKFYDSVLRPVVKKHGAYVFVLPETKTPQQLFASYDVPAKGGKAVQVAEASAARKQ